MANASGTTGSEMCGSIHASRSTVTRSRSRSTRPGRAALVRSRDHTGTVAVRAPSASSAPARSSGLPGGRTVSSIPTGRHDRAVARVAMPVNAGPAVYARRPVSGSATSTKSQVSLAIRPVPDRISTTARYHPSSSSSGVQSHTTRPLVIARSIDAASSRRLSNTRIVAVMSCAARSRSSVCSDGAPGLAMTFSAEPVRMLSCGICATTTSSNHTVASKSCSQTWCPGSRSGRNSTGWTTSRSICRYAASRNLPGSSTASSPHRPSISSATAARSLPGMISPRPSRARTTRRGRACTSPSHRYAARTRY